MRKVLYSRRSYLLEELDRVLIKGSFYGDYLKEFRVAEDKGEGGIIEVDVPPSEIGDREEE